MNTELLKNTKKGEIVRYITFLLKDNSPSDVKNEICNSFDKINAGIKKKLESIMKTTLISVQTVRAERSIPVQPLIDENAIEFGVFLEQIEDPANLRIIINFETVDANKMSDEIKKHPDISHIVEIKYSHTDHTDKSASRDMNKYDSSATLYLPTIPKILNVIEDVLLDISLYNTLIGKDKIADFNKIKIDHIKEWKLQSENWNTKEHKEYISIAGYYKGADSDSFDAQGYVDCWISLAKKTLGIDKLPVKPISEQLCRHIKYQQLNKEKIYSDYENLSQGKYYLVRIDKVPRKNKVKSQLLPLFGGKKLTVGRTKFYSIDKIYVFKNLETYVSFFIVEK